jgi:signal transduction histidine kinase
MPAAQICVAANSSCSVTAIQVANNLRSSTQIDKEYAGLYSSLRSFTKTDGADRLRLIAYAPAVVVIIIVLVLELGAGGFGSSAGSWLPLAEVSAVMGSVLGGTLWFGWGQSRVAAQAMSVLNMAEDERRTISAIGIGANWDLDLKRIFARFSNDLTTLIDYDRLTITTARRDGRMQLEFVAGMNAPGDEIGGVVLSVIGHPDGLANPRDYGLHSQMTVPISAIDGTITIRSRDSDAYGPHHVDIMRQVVAQISPGISNATNYQESQHRVMERTALAEIGRAATHETDLDSILLVVSGALSNLMKFDHMGTILTEPSKTTDSEQTTAKVVCWSTPDLLGINVGDSVKLDGAQAGAGVLSVSGRDPLGLASGSETSVSEDRHWMQVPLGEQNKLLGMLIVSAPIDAILSEDEADLLQRVANQIAPAIQNARLTADLTHTLEERRVVAAIGRAASSETQMRNIFAVVANELDSIVPFDRFVGTITDTESADLVISYVQGIPSEGKEEGSIISAPTADEKRELRAKHSILRSYNSLDDVNPEIARTGLHSWIQVVLGDVADPIGYLSFRSGKTNAYSQVHVELLEGIARQISPVLKNAQMFEMERGLRDQLDAQNSELQEANTAKSRFLSTVSHELKTPLTIVSGFIDLLADDADQFTTEHVEALNIMRKNSTRLGILINDVLDISRMDAGKLRIEPTVFQVNDLVSELEKSFVPLLDSKNQTLETSISEEEVWIEADRNRVAQLVTNLISNAHKYSNENSTIRLNVAVEDQNLSVVIEDEGIGISEDDQKQLFTAFFRAENRVAREAGGTGLGLVIARSIAELHGGDLWLNSIENQGTTVAFKIPGISSEPTVDAVDDAEQTMLAQRSRLYPDTDWEDIGKSA